MTEIIVAILVAKCPQCVRHCTSLHRLSNLISSTSCKIHTALIKGKKSSFWEDTWCAQHQTDRERQNQAGSWLVCDERCCCLSEQQFSPTSHVCMLTRPCLTLCNPWTVGCQAPLSLAFSRQGHWCRLPAIPGDLSHLGSESTSPTSPALAGGWILYHWATSDPCQSQAIPFLQTWLKTVHLKKLYFF